MLYILLDLVQILHLGQKMKKEVDLRVLLCESNHFLYMALSITQPLCIYYTNKRDIMVMQNMQIQDIRSTDFLHDIKINISSDQHLVFKIIQKQPLMDLTTPEVKPTSYV